ncbi:hypothetical protein QS460_11300 [Liquorilactobacillus mali]|uniref:hypothetical protein n=1 Tax=Liquorilactobacillus mali TaxID=1618 RepID=UPI0026514074|nr:hypothetical protein [Liquorilactobacillus mali]MDN7146511.1 hypothetical protein [Liquorilactobacillus mali]
MTNTLAKYQNLKENFNQEVSAQLQMANSIAQNGKSLVIQTDSITVEVEADKGDIEDIIITSKVLKTPLYDEIFIALEKCLNCSSIKFYNAYQNAIQKATIVSAENNHVKAVHDAGNGQLHVKITREK